MSLVANMFMDDCTKTEEEVKNHEAVEEENPFLPEEETTLVLWDMIPTMNVVEEDTKTRDIQAQNNYNLISKGPLK